MNFVRVLVLLSILSCGFSARSQGAIKLSLEGKQIDCVPLQFHVEQVIDGRERKTLIDVVKNGINHDQRRVDFRKPLSEEIMGLIAPLKESPGQLIKVAMKIHELRMEEATVEHFEYSSSRLTVDFFLILDDQLHFIIRKSSYSKSASGIMFHHENNIAIAAERMIQDFNNLNIENLSVDENPISWQEVAAFQPQELPPPAILNGTYPDAVYLSFHSFLNNEPEVTDGYEIEDDEELTLHWVDQQKKRIEPTVPVYAIAYKGQLYKYHQKDFHLIERRGSKLVFLGKLRTDPNKAVRNYATAGVLGLAATKGKMAMQYEIDLATGELNELGYMRR